MVQPDPVVMVSAIPMARGRQVHPDEENIVIVGQAMHPHEQGVADTPIIAGMSQQAVDPLFAVLQYRRAVVWFSAIDAHFH